MFDQTWLQANEDWAARRQRETLNTHCKGVIVTYDPDTQKADVQPGLKRKRTAEDGTVLVERLPVIPSVPVEFWGTGQFELIADVVPGERVTLHFCQESLDAWLSTGDEADPSEIPGGLADCVATVGGRDFGHPRVPCPKGIMRVGAVDGPRLVIDLNELSAELGAFNEVRILGKASVRIESEGDVYIQNRWVDPFSTADI